MRLVIGFAVLAVFCLYAQDKDYTLPDVVVTAGRVPLSLSDLSRTVDVITAEDIQKIPVNNIQDLLQYTSGIDVRQRGTEGVQADVSIRGGTFEQTLIMIDGIKVNDPQTGHHSLNLSLNPADLDRVEILKGQGAKSFGANAFSGVINFITRKEKRDNVRLNAMGGQHGLYELGLSSAYAIGTVMNHLSVSRRKSDGYRHNTNFISDNISFNSSAMLGPHTANLLFAYSDKEFGANGFYLAAPNQWEHTTTSLLGSGAEISAGIFTISPKVAWRRNKDHYLLDYARPSLYENNHRTDVLSGDIQTSFDSDIGTTSFGAEYIHDQIKSSNLGNHSRETIGFFAEQKSTLFDSFTLVAGAFIYNYPQAGWKVWPGIDLSYRPGLGFRIYASAGQAFRIPTYTDLYYSGGGSRGNPDLKYEQTVNYELGVNYFHSWFTGNLSVFRKEGTNIIDWFFNPANVEWVAGNFAESNTTGIEINTSFYPGESVPISKVGISYTYLDLTKTLDNTLSRYLLDHLKHQVLININNDLPFDIKQAWMFRYEDRVNLEDQFLVDMQVSYILFTHKLYLKCTNLFNKSYKDITTVPLPGRWVSAGIRLNLDI